MCIRDRGRLLKHQKTGKRISLKERIAIDGKHAVCVVEADGRDLLIGLSEGHMTLLQNLSPVENSKEVQADRPTRSNTMASLKDMPLVDNTIKMETNFKKVLMGQQSSPKVQMDEVV